MKKAKDFKCVVCEKPTKYCCNSCNKVFYCTRDHLELDFENHAKDCPKMNFEAEIADEDANGKELMYELKEKCSRRTQLRSKYMFEAIQETNDGSNSKTLISIKECLGIFFLTKNLELSKEIYELGKTEVFL
jgi:hypothetical protein